MSENGRIKTSFLDNQAREISKPALSKGKYSAIIGGAVLAIGFGAYQGISYLMNIGKFNAMKNVVVSLEKPGMMDGVAMVDVNIKNLNPTSVSKVAFKWSILGPSGETVKSDVITLPDAIPPGSSRTFPHIKLAQLSEQAARMHADLVDVQMGPKTTLTADQENNFMDIAALPDEGENKQKAAEDFVKEAPGFVPGYILLAKCYMHENEHAKAAQLLQKAVQLDPNNGDAHYHLALALQHNGQRSAAGKELRKALDLLPDDPDIQRMAQHFDPD